MLPQQAPGLPEGRPHGATHHPQVLQLLPAGASRQYCFFRGQLYNQGKLSAQSLLANIWEAKSFVYAKYSCQTEISWAAASAACKGACKP